MVHADNLLLGSRSKKPANFLLQTTENHTNPSPKRPKMTDKYTQGNYSEVQKTTGVTQVTISLKNR
jgi:hypothetical protein